MRKTLTNIKRAERLKVTAIFIVVEIIIIALFVYLGVINGKSYHIDGVSVDNKLIEDLSLLQNNTEVLLLIHPNSNTLLEVKTVDRTYLEFSETIGKLQTEKTGFLFLGIFSYICAVVGFYYMIVNLKDRYRK